MPNEAPLPESLNMEQRGMNLTEEERADMRGIDVHAAAKAMFGADK
jgi:hypothetical protein